MTDGKQMERFTMRRTSSSSSSISASPSSPSSTNEDPAVSLFSRSDTGSTYPSTIHSLSTKDEASTQSNAVQSKTSSLLQAPQEPRRRSSFRKAASQLISSSSSLRARSRSKSPPTRKAKPASRTFSAESGESEQESKSSERTMQQNRNVHTECGRHSNDWLFGNFSVTASFKKIVEKKKR